MLPLSGRIIAGINKYMSVYKFFMIFLGSISLTLGIFGIFIPGLPTTPFLLLTAWLYSKGSDRLYNAIINNKYLGRYILDFRTKKGMTKKNKIYSICLMWLMIGVSCGLMLDSTLTRLILIFIGLSGTFIMGVLVPTAREDDRNGNGR